MALDIIKVNEKLTGELNDYCKQIEDLVSNLPDHTIRSSISLLKEYVHEFNLYNELLQYGVLCEEVDFLDLFQKSFDSSMRQLQKMKKITLCILEEGKPMIRDNKCESKQLYVVSQCFSSLGLLPQILMDNAVKYAVPGTDITIDVREDDYRKTITITNIGPKLTRGEEETIFSLDENYRGENARKAGIPGQGMGLKMAYLIVSAHKWRDATISVNPLADTLENTAYNGIPYGLFSLEFSIKKPIYGNHSIGEAVVHHDMDEFLSHEYSRTNPLLGKHAREIYDESFCRKVCYHSIDRNKLRKLSYGLFSTIMEHLFYCFLESGDEAESDIVLPNSSKRFDNQLKDYINRASHFKNHDIIIKQEKGVFGFAPMYTSLYIFYYLLSEYLSDFTNGELTFSFIGKTRYEGATMEIQAPEGEDFSGIRSEVWKVMCHIMEKHDATISRKRDLLTIVRHGQS